MSIGARLTAGIVLLLLAIFVLFGAVVVTTTRNTLVQQVDARILAATIRLDPPGPNARGPFADDLSHAGPPPKTAVGADFSGHSDDHDKPSDDSDKPGKPDKSGKSDKPGKSGNASQGGSLGAGAVATAVALGRTATSNPRQTYERPVARVFVDDHGDVASIPSGYPDAPDPLPALPSDPVKRLAPLAGTFVTLPAEDGSLRYRALVQLTPSGGIVVTAAPLSSVEDASRRIVRAVVLAAGTALATAALASWALIRTGLRPVDRMIETAAAIGAGDLAQRVPDADPRTELGRLGVALNQMLAQVEQAAAVRAASEDRLRRFVADAAHELRTPLTSLRGYAELYRQGALTDPAAVAKAMGRIESEATRMARLVEDLLLLARLDQQRALEREPVDLAALAREAAADFAAADPERPLELRADPGAVVLGDRARLRQVFDNLLANARVHTPPATPVRLTVRRDGDEAEIVVADEGPGIPPATRKRIFERFWRADPGRARSRGGTGLGLAIVASLVAAHGGTVTAGGATGQGAVFTVRLPLAPAA